MSDNMRTGKISIAVAGAFVVHWGFYYGFNKLRPKCIGLSV